MESPKNITREMVLLEEIERDPDTNQITLAARLGVAVGTVNWHLKRLIAKGYVKVKRAERRKLRYIITPEGIALRARLTVAYIENSMELYRQVRDEAKKLLKVIRRDGYQAVHIKGDGEIAEICRLSCLEQGIPIVENPEDGSVAILEVHGKQIVLQDPEEV